MYRLLWERVQGIAAVIVVKRRIGEAEGRRFVIRWNRVMLMTLCIYADRLRSLYFFLLPYEFRVDSGFILLRDVSNDDSSRILFGFRDFVGGINCSSGVFRINDSLSCCSVNRFNTSVVLDASAVGLQYYSISREVQALFQ